MSSARITITHNALEVAQALGNAPAAVKDELDKAMSRGAGYITRDARENAPKADSELVNAIQPKRVALLEHLIEAAKDYASYQEDGTKPGGWPTLARMMAWVRRKGITPIGNRSLKQTAQAIRHKIAREGVSAHPFMQPALDSNRSRLDALYRQAVARGLARIEPGRAL